MNILMLNPLFYPYMGGTEKHVFEIGKRLAKKYGVTVLTPKIDGAPAAENIEGIKVVRVPAKILNKSIHPLPPPVPLVTPMHFYQMLKLAKKADIVHIHNRFFYGPWDGALVKAAGKKLCLTIHNARTQGIDTLTDIFGSVHDDIFAKQLMNLCDGIVAVSNATLHSTIPKSFKGKKTVIYNGVDENVFKPYKKQNVFYKRNFSERFGIKKKIVLTNARLIKQKGIEYLIEAMKYVKEAELVVFGRGPLQHKLEKQVKISGIKAYFISERLSDEELCGLYTEASCFALPSLYEPCSVALLEAMSCGLPVVASAAGGNSELVKHGQNGYIVPVKEPVELGKKINRIICDDLLAKEFGIASRKRILENFTWDHTVKNLETFYKEII